MRQLHALWKMLKLVPVQSGRTPPPFATALTLLCTDCLAQCKKEGAKAVNERCDHNASCSAHIVECWLLCFAKVVLFFRIFLFIACICFEICKLRALRKANLAGISDTRGQKLDGSIGAAQLGQQQPTGFAHGLLIPSAWAVCPAWAGQDEFAELSLFLRAVCIIISTYMIRNTFWLLFILPLVLEVWEKKA